MSARCKLILSFDADYPGAAGRFAMAVLDLWKDHPGIANQGHDFQVQKRVWEPCPVPKPDTDPKGKWPPA